MMYEADDEGRDWDNEDDERIFDTDPVIRQDRWWEDV